MSVTAPGKLIILGIVAVCCFVTIIVGWVSGQGDTTPAWATLTLVVGYLVGNGVGAKTGQITVPPMSPSPAKQKETLEKALETIRVADDD